MTIRRYQGSEQLDNFEPFIVIRNFHTKRVEFWDKTTQSLITSASFSVCHDKVEIHAHCRQILEALHAKSTLG